MLELFKITRKSKLLDKSIVVACGRSGVKDSLGFTSMGFQHVLEIKHAFKCLPEENT